jgi:hypothetical protein
MTGHRSGGNVASSTMKSSGKLLVAGCSVSDYTHVSKVWGEILADKLGYDYIHEAAGCGSNWRMWRRVFNAVENKLIHSSDIIVIQYTEVIRKEFWSPYQTELKPLNGSHGKSNINELYDDGAIIRYKSDAYTWGDFGPNEKKFYKQYNHFVNDKFEHEQFNIQHTMFQSYLKQRDFKNVYFVKVGSYGPLTEPKELEEYYINNWIPAYDVIDNFPLSTEDELHLSQEGHERLASLSYKYIK